MKAHTQDYKNNLKGVKEIDSIITIGNTELTSDQINSANLHYEGNILKSVMKQLDLVLTEPLEVGTELNYKLGVKAEDDDNFEYMDYGQFIVKEIEKQEDTNTYKLTCYDKMLLSMKNYEDMGITYPITIKNYLGEVCTYLGLTFANSNDTFPNYDKQIKKELYLDEDMNSLGYTFRDVLDEIAQATASTICINDDDEVEVRYITNSGDTINEEFIKNTRASFDELYGPINSIVLSRSADSDSVFLQDDESIQENGLHELKISDNQIMNDNDRSDYLEDILEQLDGLTFNTNDFESIGITYLELCDRYNVSLRGNTYSCVMFNDEIEVNNGLNETIYTDMPQETKTDYTKADKTDRKINQTYIIADKQQGEIEALVSKTNNLDTAEKNNYQDIITRLGNYALDSKVDEIETSVRQIQTDTYSRTEVNQILKGTFYDEDNNQVVSEIVKTTSGTFDENGMLYEKTNAKTSTRINEIGVKVQDTISNDELLFAGYDENINQTIVRADNMTTRNFLVVGQYSRFQDYQDGTGVFDL